MRKIGWMPRSSEDETSEPIGKLQAAENSIFASRWERFTPYIADALLQCVSGRHPSSCDFMPSKEYWGTLADVSVCSEGCYRYQNRSVQVCPKP